jgi:hypothetical protein
LYQADSDGFESNSSHLIEESDQDEIDFTKGSKNDTNNDEGDVSELLEIWLFEAETPPSDKDGDRCSSLSMVSPSPYCPEITFTYLEHLNE